MSNSALYRNFNKLILAQKLHQEIVEWSSKVEGIQSDPDGTTSFKVILNDPLSTSEDVELHEIVNNHIPSDVFIEQQGLTDQRNAEGFAMYKKIFAHISTNDAVTNIDAFIQVSEYIHKLRNFMKDGNFETAVRYFYVYVRPLNAFAHQDLYRQWIKELAVKYNPALGVPVEALGGMTTIDYIEVAESI
jgi:hypothetical protein